MDQEQQEPEVSPGDKTKLRRTLTPEQMEKLSKAREKSITARKQEALLKREVKETEQLLARKRLESRLKEMKEEISPQEESKPEPKKKKQRKKKKAPTPEPSSASSESEEVEEEEHPPPPSPREKKVKKVAATAMKQRILGRVENNAFNEWAQSLVRGY